jgi:hypothetical protein
MKECIDKEKCENHFKFRENLQTEKKKNEARDEKNQYLTDSRPKGFLKSFPLENNSEVGGLIALIFFFHLPEKKKKKKLKDNSMNSFIACVSVYMFIFHHVRLREEKREEKISK